MDNLGFNRKDLDLDEKWPLIGVDGDLTYLQGFLDMDQSIHVWGDIMVSLDTLEGSPNEHFVHT